MPMLALGSTGDYFDSLKQGGAYVGTDVDIEPVYTLANAPYSATNAATTPTAQIASPFTELKQWVDSLPNYSSSTAAKSNVSGLIFLAVVAFGLVAIAKR